MSRLFLIIVVILFLWYERELVGMALAPIINIIVCIVFILTVFVVLVCEIALIVVAPIAYSLGYDSGEWHSNILKKSMTLFGSEKNGSEKTV